MTLIGSAIERATKLAIKNSHYHAMPLSSPSATVYSVATTAAILVVVALVSVSAAVSVAHAIDGDGCKAEEDEGDGQNRYSTRRRQQQSSRFNDKEKIVCTVMQQLQPEGPRDVTIAEISKEVAVQPFFWEPWKVRINLRSEKWLLEQPSPDETYLLVQGRKKPVAMLSSSSLLSSFKEAKSYSKQKHGHQEDQLDILSTMTFANGRGLRPPVCPCCI